MNIPNWVYRDGRVVELTYTDWLLRLGLWEHALIYIKEPHHNLMYLKEFDVVVLDNLRRATVPKLK